jgi:hypothetical protein
MRAKLAIILVPLSFAPPLESGAQNIPSSAASSRAAQLTAMFSKSKNVVKEKRGVRLAKFLDIRSETATTTNPASFSGTYHSDFGFVLRLTAQSNGRVEGSGQEPLSDTDNIARTFVVQNARIDGSLLTGTKVYRDGRREKLEGVFINRTSRDSPTDRGTTAFGLGVIIPPRYISGVTLEKLFYERVSP